MFGGLNFRQIRALCACCKLHSITRRTLRFSAAYLLGFLILMISCDILANSTGRLRPYFGQECPSAYQQCFQPTNSQQRAREASSPAIPVSLPLQAANTNSTMLLADMSHAKLNSQPIKSDKVVAPALPLVADLGGAGGEHVATAAATQGRQHQMIVERQWIDLSGQNLAEVCRYAAPQDPANFDGDKFQQIAMSWPSFPAAIVTYSILFTCCYLCFIGTARPFRLLTCVLVMLLLLISTVFNVQLVKEHYHHWEDVCSSAVLALLVVIFILYVYLNKFRDTHYYENQKLCNSGKPMPARIHGDNSATSNLEGYSNDGAVGEHQYNQNNNQLDKVNDLDNEIRINNGDIVNHHGANDPTGSMSNNDLAMRYFQIPRANYRGAPRPLSSLNQML